MSIISAVLRRRFLKHGAVALLLAIPFAGAFQALRANADATLYYPDLQMVVPTESIQIYHPTNMPKELRFTHITANLGDGPLEIQPIYDPATQTAVGQQHLYSRDSNGNWYVASTKQVVGVFYWDPAHGHYHWPLASYGIYTVASNGSVGTPIVMSPKVGFCIAEDYAVNLELPSAPQSVVYDGNTCTDPTAVRGISIGWGDLYDWQDPGQTIDITNVPDGTYWFRSKVDPNAYLSEKDATNNTRDIKLQITGDTVRLVSPLPSTGGFTFDQSFLQNGKGTVSTPTFTAPAGATLMALVGADGSSAVRQTVTVSGFGLNWTNSVRSNGQNGTAEVWSAYAANQVTGAVTSTPTTAGLDQSLTVLSVLGSGGVGPNPAAASGGTGAPAVSLTTTRAGSWVMGVGNDPKHPTFRAIGPNQTMVNEWVDFDCARPGSTTCAFWTQATSAPTPNAGTAVQLNDPYPATDYWNFAAVELMAPPPTTVAGAPTNVSAVGGDAAATVSWAAPSSDGGSPITGYRLTPYIGTTAQPATTFNSTAASQTISGLANGTTYTFMVAAINAVGTGPDSAASNAVTPQVPITVSQAPQGDWVGTYGTDGYALLGWGSTDLVSLPQATLVLDQGGRWRWNAGTTDIRALQSPDTSTRRATTMYAPSEFPQLRLHLTFTNAYSGTLNLYAVDWDSTSRRESLTISDGSGPRTASLSSDFSQGAWISTRINVASGATLTITVNLVAGSNAVLSGLFLGAPSAAPVAPSNLTAAPTSSMGINLGWTGSSGTGTYRVERSPDGSTGWTSIATASNTSYSDTGLTPATTYYYRVVATNALGASPPSNVASATTILGVSQAPQGNWVGTYGADGYDLLGWNGSSDLVSLPQATLVLDQGRRYAWNSNTTNVRALQSPDASSRRATSMYANPQLRLHLTFTSAYSGVLHLYAVDWDSTTRRQVITIDDGTGPRNAYLNSDFSQGAWINVPINVANGGTVTIVVNRTAGANAVLSGVFLGASAIPAAPTNLTAGAASTTQIKLVWTGSGGASGYRMERSPDGSTGWTQIATPSTTSYTDTALTPSTTYYYRAEAVNAAGSSPPSNVASATTYLDTSQAPQGTWVGTYGADGYALLGWNGSSDLQSLPQSTLVLDQGARWRWNTGTTDVRALQSPDASSRRATSVYASPQLRLHLTFATAYVGTLHLYAVDWDWTTRREVITVDDGTGPRTASLNSAFDQGAWIHLPINVAAGGTVTITVNRTAGPNAVLSGIFLG